MKNQRYAIFPAIALVALLTGGQAHALQPLDAFLKSANKNNPKNLEATANTQASMPQLYRHWGNSSPRCP